MEINEEKRPKRPRIGENRIAGSFDTEHNFSKVEYNQNSSSEDGDKPVAGYQRPYQQRQGGYGNEAITVREVTTTTVRADISSVRADITVIITIRAVTTIATVSSTSIRMQHLIMPIQLFLRQPYLNRPKV